MKYKILKNKLVKTVIASITISIVVIILMIAGFLDTYESTLSDAFYSPSQPSNEIIIIAIDDESISELGSWPLSRDHYTQVINILNNSKVNVIGIDITFSESSDNDSSFAKSIKNNNVVLAMEYTSFTYRDNILYGESVLKPSETLGNPGIDYEVGFVNLYTDLDGVTRSFSPFISGIEDHDHFSVAIVESLGITRNLGSSRRLIKYYSEPGGYEYIRFSDVYKESIDPSKFEGKIVIIGATASNLHDDAIVPISDKSMPGVEINANLVQSILTEDYLYYQDDITTIGVIFLFALLAGIILFRFRIHIATILLVVLSIVFIILSIYVFDLGLILNILFPLLSIALVYVTLVVTFYLTEEKGRRWITSVFGRYVSPVVIENLIKNPDKIKLGGEKRNITIFFSDIRGFTSISEKLDPEDLVHLLNEYLTEMTTIIRNDQGLVDKYMGDAIMAFWGAPLDQPNHAEMACSSSLEMISKLKVLRKNWEKEKIPSFDIGIGLNSGDAIVGNMGSFKRFDYTAMGDNVNLASRMEGLNKIYGTNIIITERTYKAIKDKFTTRKLDVVKVKGKQKPILIYELVSKKTEIDEKNFKFIKLFETGLEYYFKMDWKSAIKSFKEALKLNDDYATKMFISRCKEFVKFPPPGSWDGVWEIKTK
jgi:adenylate cyclase